MPNPNRKARAPGTAQRVAKDVITGEALAASGKLADGLISASGILGLMDEDEDAPPDDIAPLESTTKFYVPIAKATTEERTITGVVLQPEVVDAQGDIIGVDVIRKAAHAFLAGYNTRTKPGLMHKDFKPRFQIVESYLAPQELTINGKLVPAGAWVMTMKVLDDKVWDQIKKGKLTGFSIGGKARVQKLKPQAKV